MRANLALKPVSFLVKFSINAVVLAFSLSCIFPVLWLINSSLREDKDFLGNITALALDPRFDNYKRAIFTGKMGTYFMNSAYLSIVSVIIGTVLAFIVGYFLSRYRFKGRNLIYLLFLSGMIVPTLSLLIPVFIQFKLLGLGDAWYTLFLPYIAYSLPMSVILIEGFVKTVSYEIEEAAIMEGAKTSDLLFRVMFPLCKPIISTIIIFNFIGTWNEFPFSLILVNNPALRTVSVGLNDFNQMYTTQYTLFMAALVAVTLPVILIYSIFSKYIIQGMTAGAVKG
ncbi:ABC transporter permease [Paenibacillus baekrokdamisoli]|uniref:ABC transporter permease n=1 Tax=Paenibacillus baekrokdamisoli TaxID=1712516 RepID=A0A3G9JG77_9BACL|nr:carbohydrate ABC transporter permease [Paenibacillus baekrokdamisoli]MBB3067885.1 raffinose/stachyose/melibiose transport system permease protein [Paenibacillus baekrokdamisoli]BBH23068.1 ABC transporter permease [Paenibacillus baekrokdamisoli]